MRARKGANVWRFYIRSTDPIVNQLLGETCWSSNPTRLPGGRWKARGLPGHFGSELFGHDASIPGRKKEGVTLSKTFTPVEELQAFPVCFCPLWTCDCISFLTFFLKTNCISGCRNAVGETSKSCLDCIIDMIVSLSTIIVCIVSHFYIIIHSLSMNLVH